MVKKKNVLRKPIARLFDKEGKDLQGSLLQSSKPHERVGGSLRGGRAVVVMAKAWE